MNLQNGYKVVYEKAAEGMRSFYASKTGVFADAEQIGEAIEIGKYKLVYEKDGNIYGSETGVPSEADVSFDAFEAVLKAEEASEDEVVEEETKEEVKEEVQATAEDETVIGGITSDSATEEELPL